MSSRPSWIPETQQFSGKESNIVQRPQALDAEGDKGPTLVDHVEGRIVPYADPQVSPGRFWDDYAFTTQPVFSQGNDVTLVEVDLDFMANSFLCDNWTNQWLYEESLRRYIPPYTGGWVIATPKGFQKARLKLQGPKAFAFPAALAGEFVWVGLHEAYLPPAGGVAVAGATSAAPFFVDTVGGTNRTYVDGDSGVQANAVATATLAANATQRTWITGFEVTGTGATGVLVVTVTVTGVVNGPLHYTYVFVAGATTLNTPLVVEYPFPIPTAAVNTAIAVSCPASGAGGTNNTVVAHGFQET